MSIVVPTRNRAGLLGGALSSLCDQHYPRSRFEVVVVDDGSTDGTAQVARRLSELTEIPCVRLVQQPPRNQNTARNLGIAHANGSLVAFLDDDEIAPVGWLSSLVDAARRHPEVDCFGGPYRLRLEGRPPKLCPKCSPLEGAALDLGSEEALVDQVAGGNMLIRRTAFEKVGPFDESLSGYWDETEWMLRLGTAGGRVLYVPSAWILHRRTPDMLRLRSRLRKGYGIGLQEVRFQRKVGHRTHALRRLFGVPRLLAHAVLRLCPGGLTMAATSLGYARESLRYRPALR